MVQKMKKKLSDMFTARKENGNKGFTLVELIVVIVILAILIGVTIGGVFGYVNKARINTDINNAAAIQSSLSVITTVSDAKPSAAVTNLDISGKTGTEVATDLNLDATNNKKAFDSVKSILSDGVPACKSSGSKIVVTTELDTSSGMISKLLVKAVKSDGTTPLDPAE